MNTMRYTAYNPYESRKRKQKPAKNRLASVWEVVALGALALAAFVIGPTFSAGVDQGRVFNIVLSAALMMILIVAAIRETSQHRERLWTALFWFRLSSAVYCGFGTIVPYIVNQRTELFLRSVFDWTEPEVLKVLQVFISAIFIVISVAAIIPEPKPGTRKQSRQFTEAAQDSVLLKVAILFLLLGGAIRYGVLLPRIYGLSDINIPAFMVSFARAYSAGLFLLMFHGLRTKSTSLGVALILFAVDFFAGVLAFDKSEMLTSLIFAYLAVVFHNFRFRIVLMGSLIAVSVLLLTQPMVHYGRAAVSDLNGGRGKTATVEQRLDILQHYFDDSEDDYSDAANEKDPLLRLSYLNAATFVVDQYDQGRPADRYKHLFAVVVPRILWPGKPITGNLGAETYYLIRNRTGASMGTTHFAEAYWSLGWWGLPIVFIPGGIILAMLSRYTISSVREDRWLRLPAIMLGVVIGHRVSGSFVTDVVGGAAIFFVVAVLIFLLEVLFLDGQNPRRQKTGRMSRRHTAVRPLEAS